MPPNKVEYIYEKWKGKSIAVVGNSDFEKEQGNLPQQAFLFQDHD